jgi:colanic acid biosynthesis protein WcaH
MVDETHQRAFAALDAWVPEPSGGLPEDFFLFVSRFTPLINVDLLIQDAEHRTLLTWRQDETYGAGWHVPGGIIRYKETAEDRIHETARRELGATIAFEPQPFAIEQFMHRQRRERGHFVSMLYRCRLLTPPDPDRRYSHGAPQRDQWAWHDCCPPDLIVWQDRYRRLF